MSAAPHAILNAAGWTYIGMAIGWTAILAAGMAFLYQHRKLPSLQMRRLPLVLFSITFYHIYWALCMIGYVIIQLAPCSVQYWIMNIWLPFGVALFQTANSQFLHIATQQRKFTSVQSLEELMTVKKRSLLDGQTGTFWQRMWKRVQCVDKTTRMVIYIAIGMIVQTILALAIYLASRKFHPSFGTLGFDQSGTPAEVAYRCYLGWEWWLSIVWQFFWAWIYAPYLIWKARKIEDTHGWRTQTILCCIAGLPASPMWLIGLYVPAMAPVNQWFIPPQWFSLCIFFIELFTIFIPVYQVFKSHKLRQETLQAINAWEQKSKDVHNDMGAEGSIESDSTKVNSPSQLSFNTIANSEKGIVSKHLSLNGSQKTLRTIDSRKSHMFTMVALEHALKWNSEPLQKFAALKDFSGENISFLTHVSKWRRGWAQLERQKHTFHLPSEGNIKESNIIREQFNYAIKLYVTFVSFEYAEFPINISSKQLKILDDYFAEAADYLYGDEDNDLMRQQSRNTVTPFNVNPPRTPKDEEKGGNAPEVFPTSRSGSESGESTNTHGLVWYWGHIPDTFNAEVFGDAEAEIKYLVLTNTWPKFVNAGYTEQFLNEGKRFSRRVSRFIKKSQV